jgi:hypothetical protein
VSFAVRLLVSGLPALNVVVVVALSALATGALLAEGGAADTAKDSAETAITPNETANPFIALRITTLL